jgi:hypothetical protein
MKTTFFALAIATASVSNLLGATVKLTLQGRVSETTIGSAINPAPVSVGDLWVATMVYDYPTPPYEVPFPGMAAFLGHAADIRIGSSTWAAQSFVAGTDLDPSGQQLTITYGLGTGLSMAPPYSEGSDSVTSIFQSKTPFIFDDTTLPASSNQWDLLAADILTLNIGGTTNGTAWSIRGNQLDSATYEVIPEPNALVLITSGFMACALRRRRRSITWETDLSPPEGDRHRGEGA